MSKPEYANGCQYCAGIGFYDGQECVCYWHDQIVKAHMAGQADAGIDPSCANAMKYLTRRNTAQSAS